ncbi:MAG: segregation/condensation protein A [Methanoregulaceae archaeon]|jgi:segregation and condensation protein A|nr:segregation/condensation protein A [Methanoregulaceae archaeon]
MAEEPVEILVQMAERGEIDPWNIDIVDVTDRFLDELERRKEIDLRVSGRTLFYAATLLRMKSEYLDEVPEEEAEEDEASLFDEGFDFDGEFAEGEAGPIERLEREIRRRLDRKRLRKSPVTLFELITELKNAEREQRRRQRYTDPFGDHLISADDVVGIAHDEGYQEAVMDIMAECEECVGTGGIVTLTELCCHLAKSPPEIYIPLLFLMSEGRVNLWQEEFFGELFIASAEGETAAVVEAAV